MTQRYAHLSPTYMAAAVSKLDGVFGDVMPRNATHESMLVPVASPHLEAHTQRLAKMLN